MSASLLDLYRYSVNNVSVGSGINMDAVDQDLEKAELDANRQRHVETKPEVADKMSKTKSMSTRSAASVSTDSAASVLREDMGTGMSRSNTSRDLERHPTALSRIETHRTQHDITVGRSATSRSSKKALPNFGGGKDDGSYDPFHPQNATFELCPRRVILIGFIGS